MAGIVGTITETNLTDGVSYDSHWILELKCLGVKYKCVLVPSDEDAKSYVSRLPSGRKIGAAMEIPIRGWTKLIFDGTAEVGDFRERQDTTFLIISASGMVFMLIFDYQSTKNLEEKSVGRAALKNRMCEIAFEF